MKKFEKIVLVILDSVGIGELPDADRFGDQGAHTLGHIAERVPDMKIPNLLQLGLGHIAEMAGLAPVSTPTGYYGKMAEVSVGKDTLTGHWEIAGLKVSIPFRTYPEGFPSELIDRFSEETGRAVIGNKPASGTAIIAELGEEQMQTGAWIVYTSADSVLQIAAHEEVIPLEELYAACRVARRLTMAPEFAVGRVIARPYVGSPGAFERTSNRHDYAVKPPERTVLNELQDHGLACIGVGKINDIFSGEGITETYPAKNNPDGIQKTLDLMKKDFRGLLFTNLVDFDSLYGHRRNPQGYASCLEEFDRSLPDLMAALGKDDLLILTADHGNDPTHPGNDHTREYVPLLAYGPALTGSGPLGVRSTFADIAATIAENFDLKPPYHGTSFLGELI